MPEPTHVQPYGNSLKILMDDDTSRFAVPTGGNLWIVSGTDTEPEPSGEFKFPFPRANHTTYSGHSGADWPGGGMNIHCIGPGTVKEVYAQPDNTWGDSGGSNEPIWRGNCLVIDHGDIDGHRIWSLYAHMRDAPTYNVGNKILAGQTIGVTGNTGYANGAHLHFEVIYDGVRLQTGQGGYERTIGWMDSHTDGSNW